MVTAIVQKAEQNYFRIDISLTYLELILLIISDSQNKFNYLLDYSLNIYFLI